MKDHASRSLLKAGSEANPFLGEIRFFLDHLKNGVEVKFIGVQKLNLLVHLNGQRAVHRARRMQGGAIPHHAQAVSYTHLDVYKRQVWDGAILHVTRPVHSSLPVQVHKQIQLLHADEFDFDPVFEMIKEEADRTEERIRFRPSFQQRT